MGALEQQIKETIKSAIPDATVYVGGDGTEHFEALVISPSFAGMMLVKQHQMVMRPLKQAFASNVHALALKTFTPEKWATEKHQFGITD